LVSIYIIDPLERGIVLLKITTHKNYQSRIGPNFAINLNIGNNDQFIMNFFS